MKPADSTRERPGFRFVEPAGFDGYGRRALELGFKHVESGPLVRSSYHARDQVPDAEAKRAARAAGLAGAAGVAGVAAEQARRTPTIDTDGRVIYRAD